MNHLKRRLKAWLHSFTPEKKQNIQVGNNKLKLLNFLGDNRSSLPHQAPQKNILTPPLVPPPSLTPKVRKIAQKGAKSKIGKSSKRKSDGKLPEQKNKISDMFSLKTKKTDNSDQPVVLTLATQT